MTLSADDVRACLTAWFPCPPGEAPDWEITTASMRGEPGNRRFIYRATSARHGRDLAVKAHSDPARTRAQFHAQERIHGLVAGCVAPLHIAGDGRCFAMPWVEAPVLAAVIATDDAPAAIVRAGRWLADLHRASRGMAADGSQKQRLILPVERADPPLYEMPQTLKRRIAETDLDAGPTAMLHGDFQLENVFVLPDRILLFDRQMEMHGTVFYDVAWFLSHLADQRQKAARAGTPWPRSEDEDRRLFFEGYGAIAPSDVPRLDLVEDIVCLKRWHRLVQLRGDTRLEDQMRARSLFMGTPPAARRPGRLVAQPGGAAAWSCARTDVLA